MVALSCVALSFVFFVISANLLFVHITFLSSVHKIYSKYREVELKCPLPSLYSCLLSSRSLQTCIAPPPFPQRSNWTEIRIATTRPAVYLLSISSASPAIHYVAAKVASTCIWLSELRPLVSSAASVESNVLVVNAFLQRNALFWRGRDPTLLNLNWTASHRAVLRLEGMKSWDASLRRSRRSCSSQAEQSTSLLLYCCRIAGTVLNHVKPKQFRGMLSQHECSSHQKLMRLFVILQRKLTTMMTSK